MCTHACTHTHTHTHTHTKCYSSEVGKGHSLLSEAEFGHQQSPRHSSSAGELCGNKKCMVLPQIEHLFVRIPEF